MDEAADAFYRGVNAKPNDISLLNFLGRALGAMGRYSDAVMPLRRLVELAPSDAQGRQNLAIMETAGRRPGPRRRRRRAHPDAVQSVDTLARGV